MKTFALLLFLAISKAVAGPENLAFEVVPNTSAFPLPYALPQVAEGSAGNFDWKRYFDGSKSEADRAFRVRVACADHGQAFAGGGDSNAEEAMRSDLAADEFKGKCDDLIRRYRLKLKDEAEVLKDFEDFITRSEEAISLQVKLVGGSWGGSGARGAYAKARMGAYLNFHRNLEALRASLHLQDLPD
jgi:hypothetical protein